MGSSAFRFRDKKSDIVLNTFNYHLTPLAFMFDESLKMLGASVVPESPLYGREFARNLRERERFSLTAAGH